MALCRLHRLSFYIENSMSESLSYYNNESFSNMIESGKHNKDEFSKSSIHVL